MSIDDIFRTRKRRWLIISLLRAYEKDKNRCEDNRPLRLPQELWGWRSVEWMAPRYDDVAYITNAQKVKKKVLELLRMLRNSGIVRAEKRSVIEEKLTKYVGDKNALFEFKQEIGIVGNVNKLWRITPEVVDELRSRFESEDLVHTALQFKEALAIKRRLEEYLETINDIIEVLRRKISDMTMEKTRGDILDLERELELYQAKIIWIKEDLRLLEEIISGWDIS